MADDLNRTNNDDSGSENEIQLPPSASKSPQNNNEAPSPNTNGDHSVDSPESEDSQIPSEQAPLLETEDHPHSSKMMAIVAILAGILVITAGFTIYKYFDNLSPDESTPLAAVDLENEEDQQPSTTGTESSGIVNPDDASGIVTDPSGNKPVTRVESKEESNQSQVAASSGASGQQSSVSGITSSTWTANDYQSGDISPGQYEVQRGDTLWEIAEAAYGDGTQWHKIADANNVNYLANGNPLIVTGQTITIPG